MKKFIGIICFCSFIYLDSFSQNVSIGTSVVNRAKLEVYGAVGATSTIFTDPAGAGISFQRNSPAIGYNQFFTDQSRYIGSGKAFVQWLNMQNGSMYFDHYPLAGIPNDPILNQTRVMTISQNGNVSLNAGEQNASFFVGQDATGLLTTRFRGTTYNTEFNKPSGSYKNTFISGGKAGSSVFINDISNGIIRLTGGGGQVGINNTNPFAQLDIKQYGNSGFALVEPSTFNYWEMVTIKNATEVGSDMYMLYKGNNLGNFFHIDGLYYSYSDSRLKKNINPLTGTLQKVLQLNPVTFRMKYSVAENRDYGFLAQEVKELFPELIQRYNKDQTELGYPGLTELYTLEYDGFAPIIIKAIQEQQQLIEKVRQKNIDLKKRIALLEKNIP